MPGGPQRIIDGHAILLDGAREQLARADEVRLPDEVLERAGRMRSASGTAPRARGLASRGRGEERARFEATLAAPGPCHVATVAETRVSFAAPPMTRTDHRSLAPSSHRRRFSRSSRSRRPRCSRAAAAKPGHGADRSLEGAARPSPRSPSSRSAPSASTGSAICPPPGELGQPWFPQPAAVVAAAAPRSTPRPPEPVDQDFITRTKDRTPTELAVEATHREFRSLLSPRARHDPAQDGRVAIVLAHRCRRSRRAGRGVRRVRDCGRVDLVHEGRGGAAAVPAAVRRLGHRAHPRGLHVARWRAPHDRHPQRLVHGARVHHDGGGASRAPRLRTAGAPRPPPVQATGTFTLTLGADGQVTRAHVDPWTGEQSHPGVRGARAGEASVRAATERQRVRHRETQFQSTSRQSLIES